MNNITTVTPVGDELKIKQKKDEITDWIINIKDISTMTFNELDQYIETNVTDLPSAKMYLKKQSKALLAFLKLFEEKIK